MHDQCFKGLHPGCRIISSQLIVDSSYWSTAYETCQLLHGTTALNHNNIINYYYYCIAGNFQQEKIFANFATR